MSKLLSRRWVVSKFTNKLEITCYRHWWSSDKVFEIDQRVYKNFSPLTQKVINKFFTDYQPEFVTLDIKGNTILVALHWSDLRHYKKVLMLPEQYQDGLRYRPDMTMSEVSRAN